MKTDQDVHVAVQWAFNNAWKESRGDEQAFSELKHLHRHRSMLFVRHLGLRLDEQYKDKCFLVHRKRQEERVKKPGETLHDIDVFEVDKNGLLNRNLWQIESELAYKYDARHDVNRPRLNRLLEDLNKLISGCAVRSLLITSREWLEKNEQSAFRDRIDCAARRWHNNNKGGKAFYVATIPFVSNWRPNIDSIPSVEVRRFNVHSDCSVRVPTHSYLDIKPQ